VFHHFGPHPGFFLAGLIVRLVFLAAFVLVPWVIGLTYIRRDAKRRGQPGWLWALATIFLTWIAILTYLIVRTFSAPVYPTGAPVPPPAE
jgi:hypothetical protein